MKINNKKYYPYYVGLLSLCISIIIVLIGNEGIELTAIQKNVILTISGILAALITFVVFLSDYDPLIKKGIATLKQRLNLEVDRSAVSFESIHLLPVKKLLIDKVRKSCEQILDNELITSIKSSDVRFNQNYIVKTHHYFYENFKDLIKKERSTVSIENIDLRKNISGLVITGEPGNGKTFGLARWTSGQVNLIKEEIQVNPKTDSKIPVFISLNNWNSTVLTDEHFEDWLAEEIMKQYDGLDAKIIRHLVQQHEIIPCADGLDEVSETYRADCLASIVKYAGIKNSFAFSCRRLVFLDLLEKEDYQVNNNIAVFELQTLTEERIIQTIRATKPNAPELIGFLRNNATLINYINTPLFLNLYMLTFDILTHENKQQIREANDQPAFEYILWEKYDDLMMHEKVLKNTEKEKYAEWSKKIRTYMVSLATNIQNNQFFIDQIQPRWLSSRGPIFLYYLTSRVLSGLIVSIAIGCFIASVFSFIGCGIFASITVTLLTLWMNNSKENNTFIHKIPPTPFFVFFLVIASSLYQGLSVPRRPEDMILHDTFSITESLSGVIVGLFFGVIFGVRKKRQDNQKDIQPVQVFFFNWRKSLIAGTKGGIGVGLFLGTAALCIRAFFLHSTFSPWLHQTVDNLLRAFQKTFPRHPSLANEYVFTFAIGFLIGSILGCIIFALLAGLDRERIDIELLKIFEPELTLHNASRQRKQLSKITLNDGIMQSLINSLKYGLIAFTLLTAVHSLLILLYSVIAGKWALHESINRALMVGVGSGVISFLWFGGFEVLQHYCLRLYLYFYGIAPLQFDRWVKKIIDLAFMKKVGAGLQFYHPKIKEYFINIHKHQEASARLTVTTKHKASYTFHLLLFTLVAVLLVLPVYNRWHGKYWSNNRDGYRFDSLDVNVKLYNRNTLIFLKAGTVTLYISGRIHVGTFTGYVGPEGTEVGILGYPITDVYDVVPRFKHGALLYKINTGQNSAWKSISDTLNYFRPFRIRTDSLTVNKGDTLYFEINDNEIENNSGHFTLTPKLSNSAGRN